MSFGFGDLRWKAWGDKLGTGVGASYPPMWPEKTKWNEIEGKSSAEERMSLLKESF